MRSGIGGDNDGRYPKPILDLGVRPFGWRDVIVEAAVVVPGEDDSRMFPLLLIAHDGVDLLHRPVLAIADVREVGVVTHSLWRCYPAHGRQLAGARIGGEVGDVDDLALPIRSEAD